tara:strand:- start:231 stop:617 length:387 start_codon:yes stop_codon:yes gene_type:complete
MTKFLGISEVANKLGLIDPITKKPLNHILRYWEKEFKEIRPKKINNRRYYSQDQVEIIEMIKFLLKSKGMTLEGVKQILSSKINKLDDTNTLSLKADYYKISIKNKLKALLENINNLKKHGKKNSSKS